MAGDLFELANQGAKGENSITEIREFFMTEDSPLKEHEFRDFWVALSDEEKSEFRKAELRKKA